MTHDLDLLIIFVGNPRSKYLCCVQHFERVSFLFPSQGRKLRSREIVSRMIREHENSEQRIFSVKRNRSIVIFAINIILGSTTLSLLFLSCLVDVKSKYIHLTVWGLETKWN